MSRRAVRWSKGVLSGAMPLPTPDLRLPPRRPRRARGPGPTPESLVLSACIKLASLHRAVGWCRRVNTGAARLPGKGGRPQLVRFGWPGASDIIGQLRDGRMLAVEVKRPGGRATRAQEEFLALVAAHGGCAALVDNVDALARVLDAQWQEMGLRKRPT